MNQLDAGRASGPVGPNETRLAHLLSPGRAIPIPVRRTVCPRAPSRFAEDRQAIAESWQLCRLANITQVHFDGPDGRSNRLGHTLDVVEVALRIGTSLDANLDLVAAIALAHDCGHVPFGHAGETFVAKHFGPFDHATWGADVQLASLDLAPETLDGVRNHPWNRPAPSTAEAEIVSWADRVAYLTRDYEIGLESGLVAATALPPIVATLCGRGLEEQRSAFIDALLAGSRSAGMIAMAEPMAEALAAFRSANFANMYWHESVTKQARALTRMLGAAVQRLECREGPRPCRVREALKLNDLDVFEVLGIRPEEFILEHFRTNSVSQLSAH